jgi:hypothetical protein
MDMTIFSFLRYRQRLYEHLQEVAEYRTSTREEAAGQTADMQLGSGRRM